MVMMITVDNRLLYVIKINKQVTFVIHNIVSIHCENLP